MAYVENVQLRLQHDNGYVDGRQRYKNRTYSGLKETATNEEINSVALAISDVALRPVLIAKKIETTVLD